MCELISLPVCLLCALSLSLSHILTLVSVGYEYETCPSQILWEKRTAVLQGYEITPSNLGGWSLDKHHTLNIRHGEPAHSHMRKWIFCVSGLSRTHQLKFHAPGC